MTVEITKHYEPPAGLTCSQMGYLKAEGDGATVIAPASLALLDDAVAVQHYIDTRLLPFHALEVERSSASGTS